MVHAAPCSPDAPFSPHANPRSELALPLMLTMVLLPLVIRYILRGVLGVFKRRRRRRRDGSGTKRTDDERSSLSLNQRRDSSLGNRMARNRERRREVLAPLPLFSPSSSSAAPPALPSSGPPLCLRAYTRTHPAHT